ncbi:hypothetical protein M0811_05750 [Anaeramoeba ignava]|uniref:Uncharacterized protein n=1 Tax=Anaeramoeba ignava TaxID=1746090 RepID=A0A9Q0REE7_ANAIG|nr:hypothetical protein M0811_05750 [Anaeramoeba ignava]
MEQTNEPQQEDLSSKAMKYAKKEFVVYKMKVPAFYLIIALILATLIFGFKGFLFTVAFIGIGIWLIKPKETEVLPTTENQTQEHEPLFSSHSEKDDN